MAVKEQVNKLKSNWLIIVLCIIIAFIVLIAISMTIGMGRRQESSIGFAADYAAYDQYYGGPTTSRTSTFSPEEIYRQVVKNSSMSLEIKVGQFQETDTKLKNILSGKDAFILRENISTRTANTKHIYTGSYTIKVRTTEYDLVISELKNLGKIISLNEGADDITGQYINNQLELSTEKKRLLRYQELYNETTNLQEKLDLNDKIFNQERIIAYLESSLSSMDERVEYSTITLSIQEKSNYVGMAVIEFSALVVTFVGSAVILVYVIAGVLPWAIVVGLILLVISLIKKRRNKKIYTEKIMQKK